MNATKKAPQKRAAFAIEDAIEETRKRIAGSAKDLQQKALAALASGPRLQTEKDGRLFAIDAMERLKNANADEAAAYPHYSSPIYSKEDVEPFRTGPQWAGLKEDLFKIFHEGTEAAQLGFCSIVTCVVAGDIGKDMDCYRELERAGKFLPWGTPGTKYAAPKVRRKTKAMLKLERKHRAERKAAAKAVIVKAVTRIGGRQMGARALNAAAADLLKAGKK